MNEWTDRFVGVGGFSGGFSRWIDGWDGMGAIDDEQ